uniref:Uncharacterized protein n=1 Tax=Sphaerodactylus townsendi TaxID=933632 RepID=A0ACB8FJI8_9SAUR
MPETSTAEDYSVAPWVSFGAAGLPAPLLPSFRPSSTFVGGAWACCGGCFEELRSRGPESCGSGGGVGGRNPLPQLFSIKWGRSGVGATEASRQAEPPMIPTVPGIREREPEAAATWGRSDQASRQVEPMTTPTAPGIREREPEAEATPIGTFGVAGPFVFDGYPLEFLLCYLGGAEVAEGELVAENSRPPSGLSNRPGTTRKESVGGAGSYHRAVSNLRAGHDKNRARGCGNDGDIDQA